jgi:Na+-driven multidrug efflux pump
VLGIVLNPLLILGLGPFPRLGIAGAGIANALASAIGLVTMIALIYRRDMAIRLRGAEFAYLLPGLRELAFVVAKGLPMGAQMLITSAAGIIMMGLVNREGLMATAAYGACLQIWGYVQMPAVAIGMAVSAMVAQNVGAEQHGRIGTITMAGAAANILMTGLLTALLLAFDRPLLALFLGQHSTAIPLAEHIQLITTWSFVLGGLTMVLSGTMRAYGVVVLPLIAMVVAMYPARLGFYTLLYPHIGAEAVWWAYPTGSITAMVLTGLAYLWDASRRRRAMLVAQSHQAG